MNWTSGASIFSTLLGGGDSKIELRQAKVLAIEGNHVQIEMGAGTVPARYLGWYGPTVGDAVWVLINDEVDRLVIGPLGPFAPTEDPGTGIAPHTHGGYGVVFHGNDPDFPRPDDGFESYDWRGTIEPNNMTAADTWTDTTGVT